MINNLQMCHYLKYRCLERPCCWSKTSCGSWDTLLPKTVYVILNLTPSDDSIWAQESECRILMHHNWLYSLLHVPQSFFVCCVFLILVCSLLTRWWCMRTAPSQWRICWTGRHPLLDATHLLCSTPQLLSCGGVII